ncbi:HEAT repeat domain-containing protein [Streptomyces sp. STR69]|uniref:HEAT repeat domain-containing protein n=1 Tax=Streptomyces sp. STR69 TaxID=1796942 RepID=UPI0021C7DEC5|nr:HEAT repeat domain-containing protein [Streptomyces sp. STR69]
MFTGIDEVDWASLRHAYGSAADVPGLLRGLAATDPVERASALDGMYGAVHHEGLVYDSTLACVPFLFALATDEVVAERGELVELLVSIGRGHGSAEAVLMAGAEAFVALVGDRDPGVRRAAAEGLVRFLDQPARVLDLLRRRTTAERDDRVLLALVESLGLFARRYPAHAAEALDTLLAFGVPPCDPGLRLAALGQLAGCAPDLLPADLVPTVVRLLGERSERRRSGPSTPAESGPPEPDTLAGRLRRLRPSDEEGAQIVRTLHTALGGQVTYRVALLEGQLTAPDSTDRCNGVWMSAGLFREWRGDHSALVALVGEQLGTEAYRLRDAAASVLGELFHLAAPAADRLHALVIARPELWTQRLERGAPALGGALKALARSGDPRATPVLAEVLARPVVPDDLGRVVVHLGHSAGPLAPALRHRLGRVPLDSPETSDRALPLLSALTALADQEAVPEVLRLLRGMPDGARSGQRAVTSAVRALDVFGVGAEGVVPVLRGLLDSECAGVAAGALWSVEGDASAVLPCLLRELAGSDGQRRRVAAEVLARVGVCARVAPDGLARMVEAECAEERVAGARALWRVTGDTERVLPVLRSAWTGHPRVRGAVAACLVDMGAAGAPLHDLVEAELAGPRRHLARAGGHGSQDVLADEQLLGMCREVSAGGYGR